MTTEGRPRCVVIHRLNPEAFAWLKPTIERVIAFDQRFDQLAAADPLRVGFSLLEDFGCGRARSLMIAIVDGQKLVGHMYAGIELYRGIPVGMVYQFERQPGMPASVDRECLEQLNAWASGLGISGVRAMATTPSRARYFRRYGFEPGPTLLLAPVTKAAPEPNGGSDG